jgi:mono/diheme cytochrome c family protein
MPAWGQVFGGPLTDEQILQIVAFVRAWEPTALELEPVAVEPDPVRGATIYARTCFVCHGDNGTGTDRAPALNNPDRLSRLDDIWYRNTISHGRPAKGMPTWGTVLSPSQIDDLVALISIWREGGNVEEDIPLATYLTNALYAIREFDHADAVFYLEGAALQADESQLAELQEIIDLVEANQMFVAQSRIALLLPPEEMGQALFTSNCAACHGGDGTGGMGPNLHGNPFIEAQTDEALVEFLLTGRRGTAMTGFEGILTPEDLSTVVLVLRNWQP